MSKRVLQLLIVALLFIGMINISGCQQAQELAKIVEFENMPNQEGYPVFDDPDTIKEDVKNTIQKSLDAFADDATFIIVGAEVAEELLLKDEQGNYSYKSTFSQFSKDALEETLMNMTGTNINPYLRSVIRSYNINKSVLTGTTVEGDIQVKVTYRIDWGTPDPKGEYQAIVEHVRSYLTSAEYQKAKSQKDKLEKINDYITSTFQYDYRYFVEEERDKTIYSAYEMINDNGGQDPPIGGYPRGVCQAYAEYGFIMLREAGFEAISIDGTADGVKHVWNMVKLDGKWYHIDFTWNDPITELTYDDQYPQYLQRQYGAGYNFDDFLLVSDGYMQDNSHSWEEVKLNYTYPKAPDDY